MLTVERNLREAEAQTFLDTAGGAQRRHLLRAGLNPDGPMTPDCGKCRHSRRATDRPTENIQNKPKTDTIAIRRLKLK